MKPLVHSYTSLRNWSNCPRKYWHLHLAKDLPFEESEAMRWGVQVHSAFENRINKGTPFPVTMAKYEQFCQFGAYVVKAEVKVAIRENGKPCDFFDSDVFARGKIDLLVNSPEGLQTALLLDVKTGKRREDADELEVHATLLKAGRPELQRIVGSYIWLQDNALGRTHDLSATEAKLEQIRAAHKEIAHARQHGRDAFPPRQNPLCGWCPVKSCEFNPKRQA